MIMQQQFLVCGVQSFIFSSRVKLGILVFFNEQFFIDMQRQLSVKSWGYSGLLLENCYSCCEEGFCGKLSKVRKLVRKLVRLRVKERGYGVLGVVLYVYMIVE